MKSFVAKGLCVFRHLTPVVGLALVVSGNLLAADKPASATPAPSVKATREPDAATAWDLITAESLRPTQPPEWKTNPPSKEMIQVWIKAEGERLMKQADRARDFYKKYPNDSHAMTAKEREWQALMMASRADKNPEIVKRVDALEADMLSSPSLTPQERFGIKATQVQRKATNRDEYEKGVRELMKEFPDEPRVYQMLLSALKGSDNQHIRTVAEEILKSKAPEEIKAEAKKLLGSMDMVGKPLNLQFTALDGRKVDLQAMKGKVVLVDFWATWCGPCVAELPNVKNAFAKLHDKGFEIVGISFDQDKAKLEQFIKDQQMTWPQYFDGQGWKNKFGEEFGIDSIPRMWLVDKKGVLRDQEAREDLGSKVEKLLAEP